MRTTRVLIKVYKIARINKRSFFPTFSETNIAKTASRRCSASSRHCQNSKFTEKDSNGPPEYYS